MESLGENTLNELMKSENYLANFTGDCKNASNNSRKNQSPTKLNNKEDSDLGKYFKDSFLSPSPDRSKENNEKPLIINTASSSKPLKNNYHDKRNFDCLIDADDSPVLVKSRYTLRSHSKTFVESSQSKKPKISHNNNNNNNDIEVLDGKNNESETSEVEEEASSGVPSLSYEIPSIIETQDRLKLAYWGLPLTILRKYESRGVTSMFQWQVECLSMPDIIENGKNLVYSAPTSAGKTLVSEILVIKTVLERKKKVIFILPFVSVVREKMYYFQDLLSDSGVRVEGFMGGVHPPGGFNATDIAIATIEKANSLLNTMMEEGGLENLGAVVIDELHLLGDPYRGYLLELLLTKLKYMTLKEENINIQLIGMSATLPNLDLLANWLDAELYKTDFRPIPLKEYCKIGSIIYDDKLKSIKPIKLLRELDKLSDNDNVLQLCLETILEGHSVLVFCPTKLWTESLAQQVSTMFNQLGRQKTEIAQRLREQLNSETIMETLEQLKRSPAGLDRVLRSTVSFGAAFHHAGLTMDERDIIEGAFRSGSIRVLTATSTLSSGVNLPARRVIIRTIMFHGKPIDTLTYKQMVGRAGRMGKDSAGESIIICKPNERNAAKNLLNSGLQPIKSCLNDTGPLIRALLEAIASEVAYTIDDIETYMKCTLLSFTNNQEKVDVLIKKSIDYLVENELLLLQMSNINLKKWIATQLGKACLAASVPPKDGLFLFSELVKARRQFALDTELHIICLVTPFNTSNQIGDIDWFNYLELWRSLSDCEKRVAKYIGVTESFLASAVTGILKPQKTVESHKRFYTSLMLYDLVREIPLTNVCKKYNCCRGIVQGLQQTASTFAGMITQFCKKLGWDCIEILVEQFQQRLQFGVCRELLDLLKLPMLNGIRARSLFKSGIKSVAELAIADVINVERALYKALPFESEKDYGNNENNTDITQFNKIKSVFITGRDGLTPREAAVLLVQEARELVRNQLGLDELDWDKKDRLRLTGRLERSVSTTSSSSVLSKNSQVMQTTSSGSSLAEINSQRISGDRRRDSSRSLSLSLIQEDDELENIPPAIQDVQRDEENVEEVDDIFEEEDVPEQVEKQSSEESLVSKMRKTPESIRTPKSILPRQSLSMAPQELRSPSLFGDSLNLDTQDCNILDQNVHDIDVSGFDDINFSDFNEETSSNKPKEPSTSQEKNLNPVEFIKPNIPNPQATTIVEEKNKSKTILWDEDSWNGTNGIFETIDKQVQQIEANHQAQKNQQVEKNQDNILNLKNKNYDVKRTLAGPSSIKTIYNKVTISSSSSNIITDNPKPGCSSSSFPPTKSNATPKKTEQTAADFDRLRRVTKRKLSSPMLVEKSPIASVVTYDGARRLSTGSNVSEDDVIVTSQAMNIPSTSVKTRTRRKLESLRIRTQKSVATTSTKNQITISSVASTISMNQRTFTVPFDDDDDDDNNQSIVLNSEDEDSPLVVKKTRTLSAKNQQERKKKDKKIDLKDLVVTTVSEFEQFNEFKKDLFGKKEISLALACEAFVKTPVYIGTKIINTINNQEFERRIKKNDGCVNNDRRLCGVAITWGESVYYMSFENVQEPNRVPVKERMSLLIDLLTMSNLTVRCFATKEVYKTLFNCCNISAKCKFIDPTVADWLLNPDVPDKVFGGLIAEYLSEGQELHQRLGPPAGNVGPGLNVRSAISGNIRACTEAALTWCISRVLLKKLEYKSSILLKTYREIEMGIVIILSRMELTGLGVNLPALEELSLVIQQQLKTLENRAYELAGKQFNFSSSKSVAQVLGLVNGNKKISTNKAVLENCDHPIAYLITNWRKLNSTFIKMVCPLLNLAEKSSRIHGNCQTSTVTGRITMHEPNLQNVPRDFNSVDDEFVISVRMAFVPAMGNIILSADYCQLELRILAHLSKEPVLCRVLRKPGDVFKNIAAMWYNCAESNVDDTMRQRTKQLCYGMIYGMGTKTLADTLKVDEEQAKEFLDTFLSTYPGIKKWKNKVIDAAKKKGYIKTLMERRRYLPELSSDNQKDKGQAERQAINTKVQGSASDITKKAMVLIDERMRNEFIDMPMVLLDLPVKRKLRRSKDTLPRGGYLVLQLHDELIYEVNENDLPCVAKIIKESMENCCELSVPLPVKVKTGPAWGELKEYEF